MILTSLPVEIFILILESLQVLDLIALSHTSKSLHDLITEFGWTTYLCLNPRPSTSLSKVSALWTPRIRARYDDLTDSAWAKCEFIARPLSRPWRKRAQSRLAISPTRLLVAANSHIYSYRFGTSLVIGTSPQVTFEGSINLDETPPRLRNITAISFVDDGTDNCVDVAFQDGGIERICLHSSSEGSLEFDRVKLTPMPNNDFVESISRQGDMSLTLSSTGFVKLERQSVNDHESTPSCLELKARSWISHLSLSSTPFAAFGIASTTPLPVHLIHDGGILSPTASVLLHTQKVAAGTTMGKLPSSAVYGISRAPLSSPLGSSPQILVSGWFDGQVRCFDLRTPSSASASLSDDELTSAGTTTTIPILKPVLSLVDRWSYDPIYSVSSGGGSSAYIAAGIARHSVVSFWDVRSPARGWSVHAPGNESSPVYSVILESSRLFGVTQSMPFVYDFGPGVSLATYPTLPPIRVHDNLKQLKGAHRATYHVLRYTHTTAGLPNEA